ncbi:hypothetical protein TIFTF001_029767 [Ficus carica]|uniref:Uncharacterized protein n=1 Tax=Ficus carica TaxID=3494 RepID=A0AA88DWG4_FICCA|nr:hypothetical protein TIFTF001_029767 [Ficus carica]
MVKTSKSKPSDPKSSSLNLPLARQGKIVLKMKKHTRETSKNDISADSNPVVVDDESTDFVGSQMSKLLRTKKKRNKHSKLHTPLAPELQTIFEGVEEGVVSSTGSPSDSTSSIPKSFDPSVGAQRQSLDLSAQTISPTKAVSPVLADPPTPSVPSTRTNPPTSSVPSMETTPAYPIRFPLPFFDNPTLPDPIPYSQPIYECPPSIASGLSSIPHPTFRQPINSKNEDWTSYLNPSEISTIKELAKRAAEEKNKQAEQDSMSDPSVMGVCYQLLASTDAENSASEILLENMRQAFRQTDSSLCSQVEAFNLFRDTSTSELDSAFSTQRLEYKKKILDQLSQHTKSVQELQIQLSDLRKKNLALEKNNLDIEAAQADIQSSLDQERSKENIF